MLVEEVVDHFKMTKWQVSCPVHVIFQHCINYGSNKTTHTHSHAHVRLNLIIGHLLVTLNIRTTSVIIHYLDLLLTYIKRPSHDIILLYTYTGKQF